MSNIKAAKKMHDDKNLNIEALLKNGINVEHLLKLQCKKSLPYLSYSLETTRVIIDRIGIRRAYRLSRAVSRPLMPLNPAAGQSEAAYKPRRSPIGLIRF